MVNLKAFELDKVSLAQSGIVCIDRQFNALSWMFVYY